MPSFRIKQLLISYFFQHQWLSGKLVSCRLFNPQTDVIRSNFLDEEWEKIFSLDVDDSGLAKLAESPNSVVIVGCDNQNQSAVGFMCVEEVIGPELIAIFHGGFWNHDMRHSLMLYQSTQMCLELMVNLGITIDVQCYITNAKADRFQRSLGFEEYYRDEKFSYKRLSLDKFKSNIAVKLNQRNK